MRPLFSITLSLFIAVALCAQTLNDSLKTDILLRTYIESEQVPLNREVVYNVELRWQGDLSKYKIGAILEPAVNNLTTRGSGSSNKVHTAPDGSIQSTKKITFYFRPVELGMAYIDGITIRYTDTVLDQEESLISSRIGVKIIDPVSEPGESPLIPIVSWSFVILIAGGLIVFIYVRYRRRKEEQRLKELSERKETVEEKYLRLLKETINFTPDNIKDMLTELAHLLSGYFSECYNIPGTNLASDNLIAILTEKDLRDEEIERIKNFYARADLVKFAGEKVNESEFHQLYDTVELLLENQAKRRMNES